MRSFQLIKVLVCPEETPLVFLEKKILDHQGCETIETIKVAKPSKPSLNLGFGSWGKPVGGDWVTLEPGGAVAAAGSFRRRVRTLLGKPSWEQTT